MRLWLVALVGLLVGCGSRADGAKPAGEAGDRVSRRFADRALLAELSRAAERPLLDDARIDWNQNAVMRVLGKVTSSLEQAEYTHGTFVDERRGIYKFDCSGMVQWVLRKAAPRAALTSAQGLAQRPLARDFQRRIARAPVDRPRGGWRRIARVSELGPGDVIAWLKPAEIDSANTGHTAFVVLPPLRAPGYENAYLVRIADSTRLLHDEDTREGRTGFGFGTILLVADPESGAPIAYGWVALRWRAFETAIALGRAES
jgi:hypothetical protein